jgi:hypothetical protein
MIIAVAKLHITAGDAMKFFSLIIQTLEIYCNLDYLSAHCVHT